MGFKLRLVVCAKCNIVKAVIHNCYGTHIYCPVCKKENKSYDLKNSTFNSDMKEVENE